MRLVAAVLDALEDKQGSSSDLITSGTMRITRGAAVTAVSVIGIIILLNEVAAEQTGLDQLTAAQKFYGGIAIGFLWTVSAATDVLARGIAASGQGGGAAWAARPAGHSRGDAPANPGFHAFTPPLRVRLTDKIGGQADGWLVVGSAPRKSGMQFCVVKNDVVEWRSPTDTGLEWELPAG